MYSSHDSLDSSGDVTKARVFFALAIFGLPALVFYLVLWPVLQPAQVQDAKHDAPTVERIHFGQGQ